MSLTFKSIVQLQIQDILTPAFLSGPFQVRDIFVLAFFQKGTFKEGHYTSGHFCCGHSFVAPSDQYSLFCQVHADTFLSIFSEKGRFVLLWILDCNFAGCPINLRKNTDMRTKKKPSAF